MSCTRANYELFVLSQVFIAAAYITVPMGGTLMLFKYFMGSYVVLMVQMN